MEEVVVGIVVVVVLVDVVDVLVVVVTTAARGKGSSSSLKSPTTPKLASPTINPPTSTTRVLKRLGDTEMSG